MAKAKIADWLDGLESALEPEAKLRGLLGHGTTAGQAREFLVENVLKAILPPAVHVGRGKVIDGFGNCSKHIDIIVYDARFPLMNAEGGGLYFVEGVLATIDVKSTIDSNELRTALENCRSVLTLEITGENLDEATAEINFYMAKHGLTWQDAEQRFHYMSYPSTYVFGFNSKLSLDSTVSCITDWWGSFGCPNSAYFPLLPRVICFGNVVGFVNDGRISLDSQGSTGHVMGVFETQLRFRWLSLHLIDAVSQRLNNLALSRYYPWDEYAQQLKQTKVSFISLPA